ncbi:MAG: SIS domain-containing protein [Candidatus Dormibacteraceae bacterium]
MSEMRAAMARQPADLARLAGDVGPVEAAVPRLEGRRLLLAGTGTSWHAAGQGAWFLRALGAEAWPVQLADLAQHGLPRLRPDGADGLIVLSHTGATRHAVEVLERARRAGIDPVVITGEGSPLAGIETVAQERSSAYTASHLAALFRLAQIAQVMGADLGDLDAVPEVVADALAGPGPAVRPPARLLELIGQGPNQWTAAEGALKARETAYVATEGLSVEQFLHGPSVALGARDCLVALDGGGPTAAADRLQKVAAAARESGVAVHVIEAAGLGELLSVFPLTVAVQRIAAGLAEAIGTDPDSFGRDVPGRSAWDSIAY